MLVETLVSSMKTSRFGSSLGCRLCNALRSAATSGRSCSAACTLFFKGQIQITQEAKDRGLTNRDFPLRQCGPKLCQRDIRLLRHQLPDPLLVRGQRIRFVSAEFRWTDAAGFALASKEPSDRTQTDVMSLSGFLQRR